MRTPDWLNPGLNNRESRATPPIGNFPCKHEITLPRRSTLEYLQLVGGKQGKEKEVPAARHNTGTVPSGQGAGFTTCGVNLISIALVEPLLFMPTRNRE